MGVLEEYRDVTVDVMKDAVDKVTKETVAEIRSDIPAAGIGGKGDYQKSWASKQDAESKKRYAYAKVVYAKDPHYRLTHLLEKGHDLIVRGKPLGRVKAFVHIRPAADDAADKLEKYIKSGLKGGR
uniref:Putative tail component n=1 Tax=Myoviridae sp. ct6eX13 TaxID=2827660 RepID=A0A8S5T5B7_9CAUD|nr:MAG TPA: putative tail component [Myoviridae sp. ct6eX13]